MRVGLTAYGMDASDLMALAVEAEEVGFASLWVGEHVVLPVGYSSEHPSVQHAGEQHHVGPIVALDTRLTDPLIALTAVAAVTTRLELGTAIYLLALRHPLITARAAATVQELSRGRLLLGVGTGWLSEEFEALGVPFGERGRRFDEAVELLGLALAGGPFEYHGVHFDTGGSVQATGDAVPLPVVFGGNTERALRRAAARADGWFASGTPPFADAVALRDRLLELRHNTGRTSPFRCWMRVAGAEPSVLARYADAGFEDVLIWTDQVWPEDASIERKRATIRRVAEAISLEPPLR